jgi:hypothetical protein
MWREDIADLLGLTIEAAKLEKRNVIRVVPKGVILTGLEPSLTWPRAEQ